MGNCELQGEAHGGYLFLSVLRSLYQRNSLTERVHGAKSSHPSRGDLAGRAKNLRKGEGGVRPEVANFVGRGGNLEQLGCA